MRFEIFLELIFVFFRIRASSDHWNLQLQDLLRQETNAFHSYIYIALRRLDSSIFVAKSLAKNALPGLKSERQNYSWFFRRKNSSSMDFRMAQSISLKLSFDMFFPPFLTLVIQSYAAYFFGYSTNRL